MSEPGVGVWIALLALGVSCYLSACSIALKGFSRKRLADMLQRRQQAERLEPFLDLLPTLSLQASLLATLANLLVLVGVYHVVGPWVAQGPAWWSHVAAFLVAGAVVGVFGVAIPLSWARYRREELLVGSMPFLHLLARLLWPLSWTLGLIDPVVRRISGAELNTDHDAITEQVLSVVEEHESGAEVDDQQKEMLEAVFELPTTTAGEIMTPRTEVCGLEISSGLEDVKEAIKQFGHSRIPVYENNLDHIVGILYAKDLIHLVGGPVAEFDLHHVLREAFLVPESKSVRELLAEFKARKVHIAVVLDEYGGTAGLVTIEDILEEIVGDIQDEYELLEQPPNVEALDEQRFDVDARMRIGDVNDELDLELPEDEDYDTLGGFVFSKLGHIPEAGESFEFQGVHITVTDVERTRVNRVRLEKPEPAPANGNANGNGNGNNGGKEDEKKPTD